MCISNTPAPADDLDSSDAPEEVPSSSLCIDAYRLAQSLLPQPIFSHSIRVYLYCKQIAAQENSPWASDARLPLLFVACILHDVGCASRFDGTQRFEVEGADAAANHLRQFHVDEQDVQEVWRAIALHTSPGIAERITPLARLVRLAVKADFHGPSRAMVPEAFCVHTENRYPRLDIEKILGDVVAEQGVRQPGKAPAATWPGVLLRAKWAEPEWGGTNKAF